MARRPALISKKPKKFTISRGESYLINVKYLGEEPNFVAPVSQNQLAKALTWYNSQCTSNDARKYVETYLKNTNRLIELKKFKRVPDAWINTTGAWVMRMTSQFGNLIGETDIEFANKKLAESLLHAKAEEKIEIIDEQKVSVQDRVRGRGNDIVGDIEEMIDKGEVFSLYDWLRKKEIPALYSNIIIEYYAPWLDELLEAMEGNNDQLKEAYAHMSKKQLKERVLFFNTLLEDAEKYAGVVKKTRAPRKPRIVSVEKKIENLKFQKENTEFKIASINPEKIIGAQELWTFNTKYKIVTVFRAIDRGGLQINRSSIIGFDPNTSFSKSAGRSAEAIVQKIQSSGKLVLRKLMDEIKTDKVLQERINENTIIMRVV
jgi:hypothetical protein